MFSDVRIPKDMAINVKGDRTHTRVCATLADGSLVWLTMCVADDVTFPTPHEETRYADAGAMFAGRLQSIISELAKMRLVDWDAEDAREEMTADVLAKDAERYGAPWIYDTPARQVDADESGYVAVYCAGLPQGYTLVRYDSTAIQSRREAWAPVDLVVMWVDRYNTLRNPEEFRKLRNAHNRGGGQ